MPETLDASCLGEQCPNWQGEICDHPYLEWMSAEASVIKGRDLSKPPFVDETEYVIYGQQCGVDKGADGPVAQRVEVLKMPQGDLPELVAITGLRGRMPVTINHAGRTYTINDSPDSKEE